MKYAFNWSRCGGRERTLRFSLLPCYPQWKNAVVIDLKASALKKVFHCEKLPFIFLVHEGTQKMESLENWHRMELDIVIQWGEHLPNTYEAKRLWVQSPALQKQSKAKQIKPNRTLWDDSVGKSLLYAWAEFDLQDTHGSRAVMSSDFYTCSYTHTHAHK